MANIIAAFQSYCRGVETPDTSTYTDEELMAIASALVDTNEDFFLTGGSERLKQGTTWGDLLRIADHVQTLANHYWVCQPEFMRYKYIIDPEMYAQRMAKSMAKIAENTDPEVAHRDAVKMLCSILESLGYSAVTEIFKKMSK